MAWASLCRLPVTAPFPRRAAVRAALPWQRPRDDIRRERFGVDGGRQGHHHPRGRGFRWHLFPTLLLRRPWRDVCRNRQAEPGFTALPAHRESTWWFSSTVLLTALRAPRIRRSLCCASAGSVGPKPSYCRSAGAASKWRAATAWSPAKYRSGFGGQFRCSLARRGRIS
jgi:hypothetical protein